MEKIETGADCVAVFANNANNKNKLLIYKDKKNIRVCIGLLGLINSFIIRGLQWFLRFLSG